MQRSHGWTQRIDDIESQRNKVQECSLLLDRELHWDTSQTMVSMSAGLSKALNDRTEPIDIVKGTVRANHDNLQEFEDSNIAERIPLTPYVQAHQNV